MSKIPDFCFDCEMSCEAQLVCHDCAELRQSMDGDRWFKKLIRAVKGQYPDANVDDQKVKKDRRMTDSQLKKAERAQNVRTSWDDDRIYEEQEVQTIDW